MKTKELTLFSKTKKLYGLLETPENAEKPLILLLHGLTNSLTDCPLIKEAAVALHQAGFPTFRFDYFGSGQSEGEFKEKTWEILVHNTHDVLNFVKSFGYNRIGLWGRSLGAILGATVCDNPAVYASVFISFCTHTQISFSGLFPENQPYSLPVKGTGKMKGKPVLKRHFYEKTGWIDKMQIKHLSKSKNVLIIQGTADKTVYDNSWSSEIYKMVNEPKKLIYIPGVDHAYSGYEKEVIATGIDWFCSIITPCKKS